MVEDALNDHLLLFGGEFYAFNPHRWHGYNETWTF
jgi:hypothetical protein